MSTSYLLFLKTALDPQAALEVLLKGLNIEAPIEPIPDFEDDRGVEIPELYVVAYRPDLSSPSRAYFDDIGLVPDLVISFDFVTDDYSKGYEAYLTAALVLLDTTDGDAVSVYQADAIIFVQKARRLILNLDHQWFPEELRPFDHRPYTIEHIPYPQ